MLLVPLIEKARHAVARRVTFWAAAFALCLAYAFGAVAPIDHGLSLLRARLTERAPTGQVVVVTIDAPSLQAAGEWPWPRERFARAIHNLRAAGAKVVAFDVDFSARSSANSDAELARTIEENPGDIVLPTFVQPGGYTNMPLANLSRDAIRATVNIPVDADGQVRRYWRGKNGGEGYQASMASVLAGAPYGDTSSFLIDYGVRADQIRHMSFEEIYSGRFDHSLVRGKSVLIGATALELGDEFSTPIDPSFSGVFIHALAAESLIQNRALLAPQGYVLVLLGIGVLAILWPKRERRPFRAALARHLIVLAVVLAAPIIIQKYTPVSISAGTPLLAQAICIWVATRRELRRRAQEIVEERERQLAYAAHHDPETDLPNRRALLEDVAALLQQERDSAIVVIAIGIERFDTMRGAIGYGGSNMAVCRLAGAYRAAFHHERVYHLSTSVLGLVVLGPRDEAERLARGALNDVDRLVRVGDQDVDLGLRAGVAVEPEGDASAEAMLEQATLALEAAVAQKRDIRVFVEGMAADSQHRLSIASGMGPALARNEFHLFYQPQAAATGGQIVGAEALLRWLHPQHGYVPPAMFIPLAEETGAIHAITRWVLRRAIDDQKQMRADGVDIPISVNISARVLSDGAFCDFAVACVHDAGADICFEITETAIIDDPTRAFFSIEEFKRAGIKVSIDDYGSGLSSLAYMKQIDADELKLDRGLIADLASSQRDRLILKSTIDLAHSLGLSVVAEGVENEQTRAVLHTLHCDIIQGYLISPPVPLPRFMERMRENPQPSALAFLNRA